MWRTRWSTHDYPKQAKSARYVRKGSVSLLVSGTQLREVRNAQGVLKGLKRDPHGALEGLK